MRDLTRREVLTAAASTLLGACADVTVGGPGASDAAVDNATNDATTPRDAVTDLPREAAPAADVSTDAVDAGRVDSDQDAPSDVAPDVAVDAAPDVAADVAPDVARDVTPDAPPDAAPDVTADAPPPCGLTDRYLASLDATAVPARGGVVDPTLRVVVARDARGLYAFSAVCPHFGCVVEVGTGAATVCPCHGSTFDDDGVRLRGPATRSLLNHPIALCAGRVYVDRSRSVAVGTRTAG